MGTVFGVLISVIGDLLRWLQLAFRSTKSIEAENLFLRRQLALYVERGIKPRRIDPVTRIQLAFLSRFCNWRDALVVVRPETIIRWHRAGWRGQPSLGHILAPARPGNHCLRLPRSRHGDFPIVVRVRRDRAPQPPSHFLQRHRTSERCLDTAAIARCHRIRESL